MIAGDVMKKYDIALFDLDGTLSQSADGIRLCIEKTLDKMGIPHPDLSDYSKYIGPPLLHTFINLCKLTPQQAQQAVEIYVKIYDDLGVKANKVYDGIEKVLSVLKDSGVRLAVCSSKHETIATQVVQLLGIQDYFEFICGSNIDGSRKEKKDLIPYALTKLKAGKDDKVVMIGDTKFDAVGAKLCCVDFVGVAYGYGTVEDMKSGGAEVFAQSTMQLIELLM